MKNLIFALFALCACGDTSGAVAPTLDATPDADEQTLPPQYAGGTTGRRIYATVGDSTCTMWAPMLQELRADLLIVNHCRNGAETPEVADHQWAINTRPMQNTDGVIILAGANDVAHNLSVPQAFGRLLSIADDALSLGMEAIVIVTLPYKAGFGATYGMQYETRMEEMQAGLRAAIAPVVLVDLDAEFVAHQEWYMPPNDYVHPNALGQSRIAQELAEVIR